MSINNSVNVLPVSNSDATGTILDHHTDRTRQQSFQTTIPASGTSGSVAGFGNIYDDQCGQNHRSESFSFGQLDNISSFADLAEFATGRKGSLPCIRSAEPRFMVPPRRATDPIGLYPDDTTSVVTQSPKQRFTYLPKQNFHDRVLAKKNNRAPKMLRPRFEFRYLQDFQPAGQVNTFNTFYHPAAQDSLPELQNQAGQPPESRALGPTTTDPAQAVSSRQIPQQMFSNVSYQTPSSRSSYQPPKRRSELSPSPLNHTAALADRGDDVSFVLPTDTLIDTGSSGSIFSTVSHDANTVSSITPRSSVDFNPGLEPRDAGYFCEKTDENLFQPKYLAANTVTASSRAVGSNPGMSMSHRTTFNGGLGAGSLYGRSSSLGFGDNEMTGLQKMTLYNEDRVQEQQGRKCIELSLAESGIEYGDPVILKLLKPRKRKKYGDYKCLHCGQVFPSVVVFAKHLDENRLIRFKPPADSKESEYLFGTSTPGPETRTLIASRKVASVDGMKMNICGIKGCGRMFKRKDSLRRHERLVHENKNSRFNQRLKMQCIVLGDHEPVGSSD
ncbi:hypothetical protein HII12_003424 [Brettanomyces bruxellensis]|uniref:C2H2-type domain-containing protein n=1 Tax=Dekkera bruxellensis TaxID=5007 RepID=A0A8H6ETI4_DEKBR|nr:hypothetical protein HII12_003424 [Brettanomyces bruxellensis]